MLAALGNVGIGFYNASKGRLWVRDVGQIYKFTHVINHHKQN